MDLKSLRYFVVVAEELNITRAAKILMMSQPPLSTQIKNLEQELHTTLFIRGRRNLKLTEEGKYLYQKAKDILSLSEKAEHDIQLMNKGISGTIPLGFVTGADSRFGASWIAGFLRDNPYVRFRLLSGSSEDLIERMRSGLISMAVIASPYDEVLLNSFPIEAQKIGAFFQKERGFAWENSKKIALSDLLEEPLILPGRKAMSDLIRKWFRKYRSEPNIVCEVENRRDALALVEQGVGIALLPQSKENLPDGIAFKEIEGTDQKVDYLFVWRKGHQLSTIEENFIDYVKARYQK